MPASKAARRSLKRFQRNRSLRTATRSAVNKVLRAVQSGDVAAAESTVQEAVIVLDRAVRKGILHRNNVARRKSRLAARVNRLRAAASA